MRRKQRNIAATLLAGMLLLLTMFTVSAQSNTITPTLKKVGYGIKDSSGTVNVYEQAFLIKSGAVNVHGGIAICFDTGKPAAKSGTTYQYIGLAQNQTGSYSAKQAYNCMLAAESIITKSKYNVVFPVIDMILAILFFVKLSKSYFEFRKHGQFELTAPCILFACLIFTLTAPLYIWSIL